MNIYQRKLLELIRSGKLNDMTRQQTADAIGLKYPSHVFYHISRLQAQGLIRFDSNERAVLNSNNAAGRASFWQIPILGMAACGDATAFADGAIDGYATISTRFASPDSGRFAS